MVTEVSYRHICHDWVFLSKQPKRSWKFYSAVLQGCVSVFAPIAVMSEHLQERGCHCDTPWALAASWIFKTSVCSGLYFSEFYETLFRFRLNGQSRTRACRRRVLVTVFTRLPPEFNAGNTVVMRECESCSRRLLKIICGLQKTFHEIRGHVLPVQRDTSFIRNASVSAWAG